MSLPSWLYWLTGGFPDNRAGLNRRPRLTARRRSSCLNLERLEDRSLPSTYTAASVSDLIADIKAANNHGGSNTITLAANTRFVLTKVDNTTDGATGLPVIKNGDNLTILGNGDTIERSTASGTPAFRLLDVAGGASLTLANLILQNGLARGAGVSAEGGAILNQGTLNLNGVTVQNNLAQGSDGLAGGGSVQATAGQSAAGGGIYSSGALTLASGTMVQNNQALGGQGGAGGFVSMLQWRQGHGIDAFGATGGNGLGGGLYVAGGTLTLTNATLSGNSAQGGSGGQGASIQTNLYTLGAPGGTGGNGFGGAVDVAGGTVTLTSVTLSANSAQGGQGGKGGGGQLGQRGGNGGTGGNGFGGGLYTAGGTVSLFCDIVTTNSAQGGAGGEPGGGTTGSAGEGEGGGLYIDALATLGLDAFTLAHVLNNKASTSNNDIFGSYTLQTDP